LKSTACKTLSGPDYFSDNMPEDVESKDAALHLRGKWLVEFAEMGHLNKSQTTTLKSFLTREVDIYRPPYGRLEIHAPRQCAFIGSTNDTEYLKDETGGRRFWPVKCGKIDPAALALARDQLFAEAVFSFREGRAWWPDADFERKYIRPQQSERYQADPWDEDVRAFIAGRQSVTVKQVAASALDLDKAKIGRADQNRITAILQTAGWIRGKRSGHQKPWVPGQLLQSRSQQNGGSPPVADDQ
jgi:predicted P-loop ATPase